MSTFISQEPSHRVTTVPTYHGYIETVQDALILFEACRLGRLQQAKVRLSPVDRSRFICSGSVFVWDEGQTGIRRWTDGRRWSSSRPRGNFIIYRELCSTAVASASSATSLRPLRKAPSFGGESGDDTTGAASSASSCSYEDHELLSARKLAAPLPLSLTETSIRGTHPPTPDAPLGSALTSSGCLLPIKPGGLTKRALSLTSRDGRRLHLVSYYLPEDVVSAKLSIPKHDLSLTDISIPSGMYIAPTRRHYMTPDHHCSLQHLDDMDLEQEGACVSPLVHRSPDVDHGPYSAGSVYSTMSMSCSPDLHSDSVAAAVAAAAAGPGNTAPAAIWTPESTSSPRWCVSQTPPANAYDHHDRRTPPTPAAQPTCLPPVSTLLRNSPFVEASAGAVSLDGLGISTHSLPGTYTSRAKLHAHAQPIRQPKPQRLTLRVDTKLLFQQPQPQKRPRTYSDSWSNDLCANYCSTTLVSPPACSPTDAPWPWQQSLMSTELHNATSNCMSRKSYALASRQRFHPYANLHPSRYQC